MSDDRLRQFESTLNDPNIAKFAPKTDAVPMADLTNRIREQAKIMLKVCDEIDKIGRASEEDARKAADLLITMAARIK